MRKTLISTLMVAVVGLAFASKGGGGEKKDTTKKRLGRSPDLADAVMLAFVALPGPDQIAGYVA